MTTHEDYWRGRVAFVAALVVVVGCGGRAMRTTADPEADADGAGGSADGGSTGSGSTAESVVSAQATSSSTTGGAGGTAGSGGSDSMGGSAGVAGVPGIGGGAAVAVVTASSTSSGTMDWGEIPIPEECLTTSSAYVDDYCTLEVNCAGLRVASFCVKDGDFYDCECGSAEFGHRASLSGAAASEACPYMVAACLLPTRPGTCTPSEGGQGEGMCYADADCSNETRMNHVKFTESHQRYVSCQLGTSGSRCACSAPFAGVGFEIPGATEMPLCDHARDWCAGDAVTLRGNRACTPLGHVAGADYCVGEVECRHAVELSGSDATMIESFPVECSLVSYGNYSCGCPLVGWFSVIAPDSDSACSSAAGICAAEQ